MWLKVTNRAKLTAHNILLILSAAWIGLTSFHFLWILNLAEFSPLHTYKVVTDFNSIGEMVYEYPLFMGLFIAFMLWAVPSVWRWYYGYKQRHSN